MKSQSDQFKVAHLAQFGHQQQHLHLKPPHPNLLQFQPNHYQATKQARQQRAQNEQNHQHLTNKLASQNSQTNLPQLIETGWIRKTLCTIFLVYAILATSLCLPYLTYNFYLQQRSEHKQLDNESLEASRLQATSRDQEQADIGTNNKAQQDLESKMHLLERYIDMIALDLQETNKRLREREKCDCSASCSFNGTRYEDRSSWQNQCDLCTCQFGKISCAPLKCPTLSCDDAVQLPGQCCPTCMKKCKYNDKLVRHGQKFKPLDSSRKECRCQDGLIKCEQVSTFAASLQRKPTKQTFARRINATASPIKAYQTTT